MTKTYPAGTIVEQWSEIDENGNPKTGNYYTLPGADPEKLGILLEGRVKTLYKLLEDTKFLQSTTKSIKVGMKVAIKYYLEERHNYLKLMQK